ncbi:hypothetical protein H2248_007418 [Termitomyces sp. 'cryptogamus']|nr:hypothetical protein H2248_007418 [Termitomyces sp. 'cryptogamus']
MPRSPSRTRTPPSSSSTSDVAPKTPTSLLVAPNIRSSPSLSNLHIHSPSLELSNILPVPSIHTQSSSVLDSTASSVINLDLNEGILVHDGDVEKECPEEINVTTLESNIQRSDEASKRTLRDHLRRTLSHATIRSGGGAAISHSYLKDTSPDDEDIKFDSDILLGSTLCSLMLGSLSSSADQMERTPGTQQLLLA